MHDIRFIREHPDAFDRGLSRRGLEPQAQRLIELDRTRRLAIQNLEDLQARRNTASKEIGEAKKNKDEKRAQDLLAEVATLKGALPQFEADEQRTSKGLDEALAQIPNLPLDEVPDGADADANVEHHRFGALRNYAFVPKQHFDLGEALGQMDFETAAKLSGARFVVLKSGLARMERAIGQFMVDVHTRDHGYTEVAPPLLVRNEVMFGTAQLPKFKEDQFRVPSAAFEALMDRITAKVSERLPLVQAQHKEIFRREMTPQEAVESLLDALRNDKSEYRALYEMETGDIAERWLIPTAEVPL